MKDSVLFKIALITSLSGIILLLFISEKVEIPLMEISSITQENIDRDVKIRGTISSFRETPGLLILNISDNTGSITVIAFKEDAIIIEKDTEAIIEGKVSKYKNQLEINAKKIISI